MALDNKAEVYRDGIERLYNKRKKDLTIEQLQVIFHILAYNAAPVERGELIRQIIACTKLAPEKAAMLADDWVLDGWVMRTLSPSLARMDGISNDN